jgi:large subunit ribosomal protein L4
MAINAPFILGSGKHDLDESVFGEEFHMALVHETARAELNARRQGTQSTKTRGEVAMTGAKAFRQKGTGRARAGALSSPQRYGGGVAFGPKPRHYIVKVNRKARRRALRSSLSVHADRGSLGIADPGALDAPSTKQAAEALGKLGGEGRVLLVCGVEGEDTIVKSFRNLSGLECKPATAVGVADIIGAARLVLTPAAADHLTRIAKKDREEATS